MANSGFVSVSALTGVRKKLLYLDDMNFNLIAFKKALEAHYEIFLAETTNKMYKILEKITPDMIILDVNMPDMDGYENIKKLKADPRYKEIPVIFLTCSGDKQSVVKGLSMGAAAYVVKPFNALKLIETINNQFLQKPLPKSSYKNDYNPSILVVDDMSSMLRTIHHALHDKYNVFLLSRSDVVIDFLQNNKPDIILMDYLMPGLSGFDLIPIIRALPGYKDIPIIIITTEGTVKNVSDAISRGASDFIVKPFDMNELNFKVEKHIRLSKSRKESSEIDFLLN